MSDPGIPIPRTSYEEFRAADRDALLTWIECQAEAVVALRARVETLEAQLAVLTGTIERFLTRIGMALDHAPQEVEK